MNLWYIERKKGFTLIELLVVISVIALLSSIVLAAVSTARDRAAIAAGNVFDTHTYQAFGANAVAVWNFNEGSGTAASDISGNGNTLTFSSNTMWSTQAKAFRGKSALLMSQSNYASVAALKGFNTANGSITFWIYEVSVEPYKEIFCDYPDRYFCVYDTDGTNFIVFSNRPAGTNQSIGAVSASSVLNRWTHVALSWSSGTMKMYVNGKQYTPTPNGIYTNTSFTYSYISVGSNDYSSTPPILDDMRVYSQSLQTAQIEKIYAEGLPTHTVAVK